MPTTRQVILQHFQTKNGILALGDGVLVGELAEEYGTPLFVYDEAILDKQWRQLRGTFPEKFSIYYSVKANPSQVILKYMLAKGCGLEIASAGECYQALQAGCPPHQIVFAGPGKTESELKLVIKEQIGEIHVESFLEITRIQEICEGLGRRVKVALRVNPEGDALGGAMRMGGKPAPFGIDEEQISEAVATILGIPCLEFCGIHMFSGTQILDYSNLIGQYRKGIEVAAKVVELSGKPLTTLDFGGGLGIPYFKQENYLDCGAFAEALCAMMNEINGDSRFLGTKFMIEPGRFLVGESGVYVTRINDIKISRGKKFLIVDGGLHHHLAASGNFGQVIKRNFPVAILNRLDQPDEEVVDVVGPLCTPLDSLARDVRLPCAKVGDLFGIFQSGAYARSASPLQFLSHVAPPEILVQQTTSKLIRRRGKIEDFIIDQK